VSGTELDRTWHTMRFYLMKMEKVLDRYKGIGVGRYIIHRPSVTSKNEVRHPVGPVARAVKDAIALGESESSVRAKMQWMPPDMLWYVSESWKKDILQFQQLQMASMIESKLEVLRKLAIAGSAPRLPALWSLQCLPEEHKAVLRVLSDLSGRCYHTPIEIDTGSPVLVKYGRYFKVRPSCCLRRRSLSYSHLIIASTLPQAGISLVSTVASEALSFPLVQTVIDAAKAGTLKVTFVSDRSLIHMLAAVWYLQGSVRKLTTRSISTTSLNDSTLPRWTTAARISTRERPRTCRQTSLLECCTTCSQSTTTAWTSSTSRN
jgi:hypothetical protein